jgi:hypothetical protein
MGNFKNGDKVRINAVNHSQHEVQGTVTQVFEDGETYLVDLETGRTSGFFEKELVLVDPDREALIRLAETLNTARLQANAIENYEVASQRGIYGTIVLALGRTLEELVGNTEYTTQYAISNRVYDSVLDGNSVREALAEWERNKGTGD